MVRLSAFASVAVAAAAGPFPVTNSSAPANGTAPANVTAPANATSAPANATSAPFTSANATTPASSGNATTAAATSAAGTSAVAPVTTAALSGLAADLAEISSSASALSSLLAANPAARALVDRAVAPADFQSIFTGLSTAVVALETDLGSSEASDIHAVVPNFNSAAGQVTALLNALVAQADAVKADNVPVADDLNAVGVHASNIVQSILKIDTICDDISALAASEAAFTSAFSAAVSAYSASEEVFPPFTCGAAASSNGTGEGDVTVTTVVTAYTTYCPEATQITENGHTYTVTGATTLTVTNCPCTRTSVIPAQSAATKPATSAAPAQSAPAQGSAPANGPAPAPAASQPGAGPAPSAANGAAAVAVPAMAGAAAVAALLL